jgi:hypothetical protein
MPATPGLFRQRDELALARHRVEAARFPIRLGLLDALLARGDEVPPDVARAIHGGPADHRQPRRRERRDGDAVAGLEDEEAAGFEAVSSGSLAPASSATSANRVSQPGSTGEVRPRNVPATTRTVLPSWVSVGSSLAP